MTNALNAVLAVQLFLTLGIKDTLVAVRMSTKPKKHKRKRTADPETSPPIVDHRHNGGETTMIDVDNAESLAGPSNSNAVPSNPQKTKRRIRPELVLSRSKKLKAVHPFQLVIQAAERVAVASAK